MDIYTVTISQLLQVEQHEYEWAGISVEGDRMQEHERDMRNNETRRIKQGELEAKMQEGIEEEITNTEDILRKSCENYQAGTS